MIKKTKTKLRFRCVASVELQWSQKPIFSPTSPHQDPKLLPCIIFNKYSTENLCSRSHVRCYNTALLLVDLHMLLIALNEAVYIQTWRRRCRRWWNKAFKRDCVHLLPLANHLTVSRPWTLPFLLSEELRYPPPHKPLHKGNAGPLINM